VSRTRLVRGKEKDAVNRAMEKGGVLVSRHLHGVGLDLMLVFLAPDD
jgi:hypothetical protein